MLDGFTAYVEVDAPDGNGGFVLTTPSWDTSGELCISNQSVTFGKVCRRVLPASKTALLTSFRFALDVIVGTDNLIRIFDWRDVSNNIIVSLCVNTVGEVQLKGSTGTVLGVSQGPVVRTKDWQFYEMKLDTVAGTFELHVDDPTGSGSPVLHITGLSLSSVSIAQNQLLPLPGSYPYIISTGPVYMKDLIMRDPGGSVNNGFQGDYSVATDFVDADYSPPIPWTPQYRHKINNGILDCSAANSGIRAATATSLNLGAGDFTLESFVRFASLPTGSNKAVIFSRWDETNNRRSYQLYLGGPSLNSGQLVFQTSTDGTAGTAQLPIVYPFVFDTDTWYHIALVRSSSQLLLFIDGVQIGLPIADSRTYFAGTAPLSLGAQVEGTSTVTANTASLTWYDETRFTVGYARYTSSFTPPTVAFPRGSIADPQWSNVALLAGYDTSIADESVFLRTLTAFNGAIQETPDDGPAIGAFSTINKPNPLDDTFIEAPLVAATSILTMNAQPANNDTVTVGTKTGPATAVYTFKTSIASAYDVLIDTTLANTMSNLVNAINNGTGAGIKFGTGTAANIDVTASGLPAGQLLVTDNTPGTGGNSVACSVSLTNGGGWLAPGGSTSTLGGGLNIPSASDFFVQRPPPNTTIIAGVMIIQRSFKTDAGSASVQVGLIGPLGGANMATTHALTLSPSYYGDVFEYDPDTAGPISPTTLINGRVRINRTL
jgi:hypothetical protein